MCIHTDPKYFWMLTSLSAISVFAAACTYTISNKYNIYGIKSLSFLCYCCCTITSGHNYDLHSEYKPSSDKGIAYLDWTAAAAEEGHNSDLDLGNDDEEDIHDILHKHSLELHGIGSNSSDIDDILSLSPTAGTPVSLSVASTSSPYSQLKRESSLATSDDGYEDDNDKECKEDEID